jgi:putative lumazine-binding protein
MSALAKNEDAEAIRAVVRDYFEGWYDGDSARMERAVHRDLAKRGVAEADAARLGLTTAARMIELTEQGEGKPDGTDRRLDIEVVDVSRNIASVIVNAAVYHEYLHLVRTSTGWKIANALWEFTSMEREVRR